MKRFVHCVMWIVAAAGAAIATFATVQAMLLVVGGAQIGTGELLAGLMLAAMLAIAPYCLARCADELMLGLRLRSLAPSDLAALSRVLENHQSLFSEEMRHHCNHLSDMVLAQPKLHKTDVVCGWAAAIRDAVKRPRGDRR